MYIGDVKNMVSVAFIIRGIDGSSAYYNANVKPFVDLSIGLTALGHNPVLLVPKTEMQLKIKIDSLTEERVRIIYYNERDLRETLLSLSPEYMMIEDNVEFMKTIIDLNLPKIRTVVFVQYLYAVNTNKQKKRGMSLTLRVGSFLPWRFLTSRYRRLLRKFDYITANSQTCGYILRQFYDVSVSGIVYPPVGMDMRKIINTKDNNPSKKGILVFAGNMENDYFYRDLKKEVIDLRKDIDEPVRILAGSTVTAVYFKELGIQTFSKLPVEDLVKLFSDSRIVYVPTAYELFGYVGAESVLCGTPVVLDAYHPFLERFPTETGAVRITNPASKISEIILDLFNSTIDMETAKRSILNNYSAEESARSLINALNVKIIG